MRKGIRGGERREWRRERKGQRGKGRVEEGGTPKQKFTAAPPLPTIVGIRKELQALIFHAVTKIKMLAVGSFI